MSRIQPCFCFGKYHTPYCNFANPRPYTDSLSSPFIKIKKEMTSDKTKRTPEIITKSEGTHFLTK